MGDKVPADMKTKIEDQVKVLKKAIESDDAEQMKKETETLQNLQNWSRRRAGSRTWSRSRWTASGTRSWSCRRRKKGWKWRRRCYRC